jgi:tetratricopeptide (TPR) repeat protein
MRYHAFISYSHGADARLAPVLQRSLHRFAKPWWQLRAVNVFRDETSLALAHNLPETLTKALEASEHFILMASPLAAGSKWVSGECEWWVKHKDPHKMLVVLSEGEIAWDDAAGDFDWVKTTALPPVLKGVFKHEPLYLDLRWTKAAADFSTRDPRFLDAAARISAALRGMRLEEIAGEEVRQHRKTRRVAYAAVSVIALLAAGASAGAWIASENAREARRQQGLAEERRIEAERQSKIAEQRRAEAEKNLEDAVAAAGALTVELAEGFRDFEGITLEWRERLLGRAESIFERVSKSGDSVMLRYQRGITAVAFAQLYLSLDSWELARERAEQARRLLQKPPEELLLRVMFGHQLLLVHISLGDASFGEDAFGRALEDYHTALSLSDESVRLVGRDDAWARQRAIVHQRLGQAKLKLGRVTGAMAEYEVALAMLTELAGGNSHSPEAQRDLSVLHEKIGDLKRAQKDYAGAHERYVAALDIVARLAVDTRNTQWQRDQAQFMTKIAEIYVIQRRPDLALKEYDSALAIRKRLASIDPENWTWQRAYALTYGKIAALKAEQRNHAEAVRDYRAASALYQRITREKYTNRPWKREYWAILVNLGISEAEIGNVAAGLEALRGALEISEGLALGATAREEREVYFTLTKIGMLSEKQKDWAAARTSYRRADLIVTRMLEKHGDNEDWRIDRDWIVQRIRFVDEQSLSDTRRHRVTQ